MFPTFISGTLKDRRAHADGLCDRGRGREAGQRGEEILVYVRPEEFVFADKDHGMEAKVLIKRFLGKYIHYVVDCGTGRHVEVTADTSSAERIHNPGETVYLGVNVRRVNLFDKKTEVTLLEGVESHV